MIKTVIISSRENPLHSLENELKKRGHDATVIFREDVGSLALMQAKADELGAPDCLVISALCDRSLDGKNLYELEPDEYKKWKYYSLTQFYEINAAFVKKMAENGGGRILGIISGAGVIPAKKQCMNGGAGAALYMGIQCVSEESHEEGIYANVAAVGAAEDNDDIRPMINDAEMMKHVPSGTLLKPEKIAAKLADILEGTDEMMTGNVITLDAGFSCAYMREW